MLFQKCCLKIDAIQRSFNQDLETLKQELMAIQEHVGGKENFSVRRSPRLLKAKSSALSPLNTNLRMSTLKKNLKEKVTLQNVCSKSEKAKKAEEMYNMLRENHPVLQTPLRKTTDNGGQTPNTRSLSMALKMQCMMLQDTPMPSKTNI